MHNQPALPPFNRMEAQKGAVPQLFWTAVRTVEPDAQGERQMPGTVEGDIAERFALAGLEEVTGGVLQARASYADFGDFWQPFTYGVGPAGQYLESLSHQQQVQVRDACCAALPTGAFTLDARAWSARGTVPDSLELC